jgi:pyrroline-5-carboxylate reductase
VIAAPSEAAYRQGAAVACYYGWVLALMAQTIAWTRANGMDEAGARLLVAQMTRGASTVMRERTGMSPAELVGEVTYPGSFTRRGLAHLNARGAFPPWQEALSLLFPPADAG